MDSCSVSYSMGSYNSDFNDSIGEQSRSGYTSNFLPILSQTNPQLDVAKSSSTQRSFTLDRSEKEACHIETGMKIKLAKVKNPNDLLKEYEDASTQLEKFDIMKQNKEKVAAYHCLKEKCNNKAVCGKTCFDREHNNAQSQMSRTKSHMTIQVYRTLNQYLNAQGTQVAQENLDCKQKIDEMNQSIETMQRDINNLMKAKEETEALKTELNKLKRQYIKLEKTTNKRPKLDKESEKNIFEQINHLVQYVSPLNDPELKGMLKFDKKEDTNAQKNDNNDVSSTSEDAMNINHMQFSDRPMCVFAKKPTFLNIEDCDGVAITSSTHSSPIGPIQVYMISPIKHGRILPNQQQPPI
uniref:Uncharacterized protein n=1 Tax=Acrobeloides nanus TaxID=290746 RepID=A0A914EGX1_9BILA